MTLDELKRRYLEDGFSTAELADLHGCHEWTMTDILRQAGVAIRGCAGALTSPRITPEIVERAIEMLGDQHPNEAISVIARQLDVPRKPLRRAMKLTTKLDFGARKPELAKVPIGALPPDHPFYALDQEMAAARRRLRYDANPWPVASSLAEVG